MSGVDRGSIAAARDLFPGTAHCVYLDAAVKGLLPAPVRHAVDRYLDRRMEGRDDKRDLLQVVERMRVGFAALIGAGPDEVAITKNTSEGLNIVAAGLPWEAGDNLVFCPELEHPNNVYPWLNLRRRLGVELRAVPAHDGHMPVAALIAAIDSRTRVVTVPTVSFSPGFVTPLAAVAEACRMQGAVFLVDAAQSVGVLHTDVRELGVDALAVATQKGILALYGMGLLYCRRELAERLSPVYLARYGVDLGADAHETAMRPDQLALRPGARRFDLGNYNYLGAVAANAALELLLQLGTRAIEAHVRRHAHRLARGLLDLGLPVCGGAPGPHLGHIVSVGTSGGGRHDTAEDPAMNDLYSFLTEREVRLSIRRGVLRFALHVYNDEHDVDRVIELARVWRSGR